MRAQLIGIGPFKFVELPIDQGDTQPGLLEIWPPLSRGCRFGAAFNGVTSQIACGI